MQGKLTVKWTLCWLTGHEFDTRVSVWVVFPVLFNSLNIFIFPFADNACQNKCVPHSQWWLCKGLFEGEFSFYCMGFNECSSRQFLTSLALVLLWYTCLWALQNYFLRLFLVFSKVGAVVEAKTPEGVMEGVITKLTDASVYTVGKHQWFFFLSVV